MASRLLVVQQRQLAAAELPLSQGRPPKSPLRSWGQPGAPTLKTTAARGASHFESVVRDTPRAVVR